MKDAEPVPERPPFFMQVKRSVAVDKPASVYNTRSTETGVVI
jgi:hypothetical protein